MNSTKWKISLKQQHSRVFIWTVTHQDLIQKLELLCTLNRTTRKYLSLAFYGIVTHSDILQSVKIVDQSSCIKSVFDWLGFTNSWCPCAVLWTAHQWDHILPCNFQYQRHTWWLEGVPASLLLHPNQVGSFCVFCHQLQEKLIVKKLLRGSFGEELCRVINN